MIRNSTLFVKFEDEQAAKLLVIPRLPSPEPLGNFVNFLLGAYSLIVDACPQSFRLATCAPSNDQLLAVGLFIVF